MQLTDKQYFIAKIALVIAVSICVIVVSFSFSIIQLLIAACLAAIGALVGVKWPAATITLYFIGWPIYTYYFKSLINPESPQFRYFIVFCLLGAVAYTIYRNFSNISKILSVYLLAVMVLGAFLFWFSQYGYGDPKYGAYSGISFLWRGVFPTALILLLIHDMPRLRQFFTISAVVGALGGGLSLLLLREAPTTGDAARTVVLFDFSPIHLSRLLSLCALCAAALFWKARTNRASFFWLCSFLLSIAGALFTQERQGFLALILASLVFLWLAPTSKIKSLQYVGVLAFISLGVLLLPEIFWRLSRFVTGDRSIDIGTRLFLFKDAWSRFIDNPIVGSGVGSGTRMLGEGFYPHNIVLEFASEMGIVGLTLFGFLLWLILQAFRQRGRLCEGIPEQRTYWAGLVAMFIFNLAVAMVSGNLGQDTNIWVYAALIWAFSTKRVAEGPGNGTFFSDKSAGPQWMRFEAR